jgi:probable F420-dependent oxidoreductase
MAPFFNPGPIEHPFIPIHIAGVNPGLAHLAGEVCEGFHLHPFHTRPYIREILLPAVSAGALKSGRVRADVSMVASVFTAVDASEREFCRQQVSFYASTPSYRPVLEHHGWAGIGEKLSHLAARGQWSDMPGLITDDILAEFCTEATTPAELAACLKERYAGLADRLMIYHPFSLGEKDGFWKEFTQAFLQGK